MIAGDMIRGAMSIVVSTLIGSYGKSIFSAAARLMLSCCKERKPEVRVQTTARGPMAPRANMKHAQVCSYNTVIRIRNITVVFWPIEGRGWQACVLESFFLLPYT